MFDILKKLIENQDGAELDTEEPYANAEENITEEKPSEELKTQEPYQSEEEKILSMLETLGGEEQALLTEKSQLVNMEETLKQQIREEIEIKRHKIENLKHEIPELKQRCEVLSKALNVSIQQ
jgi:predicted RNase H-like nuclease (RuvC/YqgF family)